MSDTRKSTAAMQPIWTPADAEALRRDIAAPAIIGQSVILSFIVGAEGITL